VGLETLDIGRLPPTLTYANELQLAYDHFNAELFAGELPHCLITMQRKPRTMGYYSHERFFNAQGERRSEISINPEYLANYPLQETMQTLVHEMVHLWQFHFGTPSRRGYHNREWAEKMKAVGLMPSTTGRPGGAQVGEKMSDYAIAGGVFLASLDRLMASDFAVTWRDRFAQPGPAAPQPKLTKLRERLQVAGDVDDEDPEDPEDDTDDGSDAGYIRGQFQLPDTSAAQLLVRENKSNRLKYTCFGCSVNVWGKPGLRIVCGQCDEPFTATGYADDGGAEG
jgi:predicted SprT family Zn-dependent metalloprotease